MLWSRDQEFGRATVQQLALEEARTRTDPTLAATVTATVDYWPCPARPLPLGTVVLMLSRGLQPGRPVANEMDTNAAKLGQYMLRWADGDPPTSWVLPDPPSADLIPRRPWLATTTVEIGIGDWWPGRYPLLCRVHELGGSWGPRDDPARVPLGKALSDHFRSKLTVKIDQKRFPWLAGRPANGLPIEETNLMAAIPKPTATTVDLTAGIPFTLGETGLRPRASRQDGRRRAAFGSQ
jgi:hypothetical protein